MSHCELAQLNIAWLKEPLDSPLLADFVANLDRINALADRSPGFVWRLETDEGDATALRPLGDDVLVNMSVWKDLESLHAYVYKSDHAGIMSRRKEWFHRMQEAYLVLWWVPAGHRPDIAEAKQNWMRYVLADLMLKRLRFGRHSRPLMQAGHGMRRICRRNVPLSNLEPSPRSSAGTRLFSVAP